MNAEQTRKRFVLRLYNANRTGEMAKLAKRFEEVLRAHFPDCHQVEIIDVLTEPERAAEEKVFVTPTLVKAVPEPLQRVMGDLSDPQKVLMLLGVFAVEEDKPEQAKGPD